MQKLAMSPLLWEVWLIKKDNMHRLERLCLAQNCK
jgi:hypothetical protein